MWLEVVIAIGLIASAVFAMYLKETVASVLSMTCMMFLLSMLYFTLDAPFAAIFQLALGTGTSAIFLLAGDSLTKKNTAKTSTKTKFLALIAVALLCIPVFVGSLSTHILGQSSNIPFSTALWDLRAIDVIAQGLVVLTVAIGVVLLLSHERRQK
jgi:multisubunit Na+/H+ antiporter MnhB subunit